MRKVLLFGTAILVATSVLAFGGGGKNRKGSIYRGTGVDSINVHINGKGSEEGTDEHGCPKNSSYNEQYDQCFCENGYYMWNHVCVPTRAKCDELGGYWCTNSEYSTCEKSESDCYVLCPEDRKCNGTCCGEGNTCHQDELGVYQCCNDEIGQCCDAGESRGYGRDYGGDRCCPLNSVWTRDGFCFENAAIYKNFPYQGNDHYFMNEATCGVFDSEGNCIELSYIPQEGLVCYGIDSNGHCRSMVPACPEGQTPYCQVWKKGDYEFADCNAGPGRQCCSGTVIYGEKGNLDICNQ